MESNTPSRNNFDLVDDVFCFAAESRKSEGMPSLTNLQRVVYLTWGALGVLENGSFQYFLENEMNAMETEKAFREIGLQDVADAFFEVRRLLENNASQGNWEQEKQFLDKNYVWFDGLAKIVVDRQDEIESRLAELIRIESARNSHR